MDNNPLELPQKLYYLIGEVADSLSINASVIRHWEKELGTLHSKKNKKGERLFTPADIEKLKKVHYLIKEKGYTIEGAKNVLKNQKQKLQPNFEAVKTLQEVKDFLLEIKQQLNDKEG